MIFFILLSDQTSSETHVRRRHKDFGRWCARVSEEVYYVQVGVFSSKANAENTLKKSESIIPRRLLNMSRIALYVLICEISTRVYRVLIFIRYSQYLHNIVIYGGYHISIKRKKEDGSNETGNKRRINGNKP